MTPPEATLFSFPIDLLDEGIGYVLDTVQTRAGLDGLTLAVHYHAARDVLAHNPRRVVYFHEPDALAFPPDAELYRESGIRPRALTALDGRDLLAETYEQASIRGMRLDAWTTLLHCDRGPEGIAHTTRNAFGDASEGELCPANPDAIAYIAGILRDTASRPVNTILAEGLHFHAFDHGYHHERSFVGLDPRTRFLLSLCFCSHCTGWAELQGIDVERLMAWVRREIRDALTRDPDASPRELERAEVQGWGDGLIGRYLDTRSRIVEQLIATAAAAVRQAGTGAQLLPVDPGGALKGYSTGQPSGASAAASGWMLGFDSAAAAKVCGALQTTSYARELTRIESDFRAYQGSVGHAVSLGTILRPAPPDCGSESELSEKVKTLAQLAAARIDFYHYGLARLEALDWIAGAIASER
jgi:hypothetical protein